MWQQWIAYYESIQFLYPAWLWAYSLSLLVVSYLLFKNRLQAPGSTPEVSLQTHYRHTRLDILKQIYHSHTEVNKKHSRAGQFMVYAGILLLIHISLAHPYRLGKQLPDPPAYRDTLFIVDTSISMLLEDYLVDGQRVDRMTMMKSVLNLFINELDGNRIGIVAFSEQAYTLSPLTSDYQHLKHVIRRLKPAILTGRTSHPGKALLYTLKNIQQDATTNQSKPVIVMVSDVNRPDRELDPAKIADYIQQQGYRIHTIGIGASDYKAAQKTWRGLIYHPANYDILERIAEQGGGQFYRAENTRSLRKAMQAIQSNEKHKTISAPRFIKLSLYQWPIMAVVVWLMVLQLWPRRRHSKRQVKRVTA